MIEQFPIEPEELMQEAHRVEVFYEEPQEFGAFEKKGKNHGQGRGGGHQEETPSFADDTPWPPGSRAEAMEEAEERERQARMQRDYLPIDPSFLDPYGD